MPQPPLHVDIERACFTLSDSGLVIRHFVFQANEVCSHTEIECRHLLVHLRSLKASELATFGGRLARLDDAGLRLWGAGEACELCNFLRALAARG